MTCQIILENTTNNETFTYALILLKGRVASAGNLPEEITINNNEHKLNSGTFRCLIELEIGENIIDLKCETNLETITLFYTPRISELTVRPLYIICNDHDGHFQAPNEELSTPESAVNRITTCSKLLQAVFAEKLHELEFGRKTFVLEETEIFRSSLDVERAVTMQQEELWSFFGREIMDSKIGSKDVKYLGFLSCTKYHGDRWGVELRKHEDLIGITDAYVALGGGGLALFGTGCLYTWPENVGQILDRFQDGNSVDKTRFLDDSAYRNTLGACFSTTLGSVLHELCHTFDLGHTPDGIMGRGFDNIRNIFVPHNESPKRLQNITLKSSQLQENQISIKVQKADAKCFIRKPQFTNEVLNRTPCIDDIRFTKSSACILAYHKWFNKHLISSKNDKLSYDKPLRLLKSTSGIRVVEIRRNGDEMVVHNWCFTSKILKYNFQIEEINEEDVTLFTEDNSGNILKISL